MGGEGDGCGGGATEQCLGRWFRRRWLMSWQLLRRDVGGGVVAVHVVLALVVVPIAFVVKFALAL